MKTLHNCINCALCGLVLLIVGCNSQSTIYNAVITTEKNNLGQNQAQLNAALNKYIYVGMNLSVALKLLHEQDFDITESTVDGFRDYPDGELNRYYSAPDVAARVSKNFATTKLHYKAERFNEFELLGSSVVVMLKSDGNKVLVAEAYVDHY